MSVADRDHKPEARDSERPRFIPQTVVRRLSLIEARAARAGDETLTSAVNVGRQALADWEKLTRKLNELEAEYQGQASLESRARLRLRDVLDLLDKLVGPSESSCGPAGASELTPSGLTFSPACWPVRDTPSGLAVRMLGTFDLTIDGRPVTHWHGQRTRALMQFLTAHRRRGVSRDELIAAVWPDIDEDNGRHRLHQGIYELRSTLRAADPYRSPIVCVNGAYGFDQSVPMWVDAEVFDDLVAAAMSAIREQRVEEAIEMCQAALELYRGDFLRQATDADWATSERNRLAARFVLLSIQLGELLTRRGDCREALAVLDQVLSTEPWNEDATVLKMRCYAKTGACSMAAAAYRACAEALASEFGIMPAAHTVSVYEQIRSGALAGQSGRLAQTRDRTAPRPASLPVADAAPPAR